MNKTVFLFYLSCLLAFISGHAANYSVIIFAQDILNSDLLSGIGFGLCFGPPIILGWYAGVLCDRIAPGRIIVLSQISFMMAGLILYATAGLADQNLQAGLLILAAFLCGAGWSFIAPARFATLAQIVPLAKLHKATVILNLLTMLGFGAAPVLIAVVQKIFGWDGVFITITTGFMLASVLMYWTPTTGTEKTRKKISREIAEGIQAVQQKPLLAQLLLSSILAYMLMGPMQVLLPRLASSQLFLTGIDRGLYLGVLAVALILGGVICMALKARIHDGRAILFGALIAGLSVIAISQISNTLLSAAVLLFSGMTGGIIVSLIVAGLQAEAGADVRGRVIAMYTITSQVIPAASGLAAGILSEYLGVVEAMFICGTFIALFAAVGLLKLGVVRSYHRAHP